MSVVNFLTHGEREKLDQFMEIVNIHDEEVAMVSMTNADWNLERAIGTHLALGSEGDIYAGGSPLDPVDNQRGSRDDFGNDEYDNNGIGGTANILNDEVGESSTLYQVAPPLMMPHHSQPIPDALKCYTDNFNTRYQIGSTVMPKFYTDTLRNAVKEAFDQENPILCRPLAFFINNENSSNTRNFVTNVLCNELVTSYLATKYILYPWDVTEPRNLDRFLRILTDSNMSSMHYNLKSFNESESHRFPYIAIVLRKGNWFEVIREVNGTSDLNEVVNALYEGFEELQEEKLRVLSKQVERKTKQAKVEEERKLIDQQNEVYYKNLKIDTDNLNKKRIAAKSEIETTRPETKPKITPMKVISVTPQNLPEEPNVSETNIVTVKFRLPKGIQATRRFHKTSPIRTLFDFLAVKNFSTESIRVFNSDIPKKDISQLYDISKTFGDVNWPEREILFVEETEN